MTRLRTGIPLALAGPAAHPGAPAAFAVASIRRWWEQMGRAAYPAATRLLITADGGGSNGWRLRLWKLELQKFADQARLGVAVCHFPPGTSKWNKIEHRLFCFITKNWRGRPLTSYQTVVNLIASTTTKASNTDFSPIHCAIKIATQNR